MLSETNLGEDYSERLLVSTKKIEAKKKKLSKTRQLLILGGKIPKET